MENLCFDALIADKAFDNNALRENLAERENIWTWRNSGGRLLSAGERDQLMSVPNVKGP